MLRILAFFSAGLAVCCATCAPVAAQTWIGPFTGTTNNWSTASSWDSGVPVSGTGTALVFTGSPTSYTAINDLGNPFVLNSITFGNQFTAPVTISNAAGSTLELGGANPFISGPLLGGHDMNSNFSTGVKFASDINLDPSSGAVTLGGNGLGSMNFGGIFSGSVPGGLRIVSNTSSNNWSAVVLRGANTFTGNVIVDGGHLLIGNAAALGDANTNTLIFNGGWIAGASTVTVANNISLNADLQYVTMGSTLTLTGVISGNHGLRMSGMNATSAGLRFSANNTYTGQTVFDNLPSQGQTATASVNNSFIELNSAEGAISNTSGIVMRSGEIFLNDNIATTLTGGRINDSANVTMAGAYIRAAGGSTANYNETMGGLVMESGQNALSLTANSGFSTDLTFSSLTRQNNATMLFRGSNLGSAPGAGVSNINFTTAPTGDLIGGGGAAGSTTISILPYGIGQVGASAGDGNSLVTLESGRVRPLDLTTEYDTTIVGGSSTQNNVRLTASIDLASASATDINALVIANALTLSNSLGGSLRVGSGVIASVPSNANISVDLDFGTREINIFNSTTMNLSGVVSGTGGLTKSSDGVLTLSGANTYSGNTTINNGTILFTNAATAFGNSTAIKTGGMNGNFSSASMISPTLQYSDASAGTLSQDIEIRSGSLRLNASSLSGSLQVDGLISGNGSLYVNSLGGIILTNNSNSYAGETRIDAGSFTFSNDSQLGTGSYVDFSNGTNGNQVNLDGDWTTSRHVNISGTTAVNTNANNWTQNGKFSGWQTLNKSGSGTWTLNAGVGENNMSGAINVLEGAMIVNGFVATSTNALTVSVGALVGGAGVIDRTLTVSSGATVAPGASPGTLTVTKNSATAINMAAFSIFEFEINDATGLMGVNWDQLNATNGLINLEEDMIIRLLGLNPSNALGVVSNFNTTNNYTWEFLTGTGFTGTAFGSMNFTIDDSQFVSNNSLGGGAFSIVQVGSTGLAIQFISAVPEPGAIGLLGVMAVAMLSGARRRRA